MPDVIGAFALIFIKTGNAHFLIMCIEFLEECHSKDDLFQIALWKRAVISCIIGKGMYKMLM